MLGNLALSADQFAGSVTVWLPSRRAWTFGAIRDKPDAWPSTALAFELRMVRALTDAEIDVYGRHQYEESRRRTSSKRAENLMRDTITHAELAQEAAALSSDATGWIHRVMGSRDDWGQPAQQETVDLFLAAIQRHLDSIRERSGKPLDCTR